MSDQAKMVGVVVDFLEENDHDVSTLDLLDALASTGLRLAEDPAGEAGVAYVEAIKAQS